MIPKFLLSVLFFIGLLGNLAAAASSLDIQRDTSVESAKLYSWGSKCVFDKRPDDATFLTMIEQAYKDMAEKSSKAKLPAAMIGLSIGNEVYFSSSVKGAKTIVYELSSHKGGTGNPNPDMPERYKEVTEALAACSREGQKQHKNNGACGELTSTLSWMIDHPHESPKSHDPKIAAFNRNGYLEPCATGEKEVWGCAEWTKKMGLKVVSKIDNRPTTFPDPTHVDHIPLSKCMMVEASDSDGDKEE